MSITITNADVGSVELEGGKFDPNSLITVGGAVTLLAGTILARDSGSLKYVPFVKGGSTNENGIPKAVLTYPITSGGAGDVAATPLVGGSVKEDRLIIDADGDNSNVDNAVLDQLRAYGITPVPVQQLAELDNQ